MLKRLCDRCETEISDDEKFFRMKCYEMDVNDHLGHEIGAYDLCEECFADLKEELANKN